MSEKDNNKAIILSTLGDIENSAFDVLLQQLFVQLKVLDLHSTPSCLVTQPVPVPGMFSYGLPKPLIQEQHSSEGLWARSPLDIGSNLYSSHKTHSSLLEPAGKMGAAT